MSEKYVLANIKIPMLRRSTGKVESLLDYISIEFEKIDELPPKPDYKANYDFIKQKLGSMLTSKEESEHSRDLSKVVRLPHQTQPLNSEEKKKDLPEPLPTESVSVSEERIEEPPTTPVEEEINGPIFEAPKYLSEGSLFRYVVNVDNDTKKEEVKIPFLSEEEPGPITFKSKLNEEEHQPTKLEVAEKEVLQELRRVPKEQWSERVYNIKATKRIKRQQASLSESGSGSVCQIPSHKPCYNEHANEPHPSLNGTETTVEPEQQEPAPEIITAEEIETFQKRKRGNRNSFKYRGIKSSRYTAKEYLE
jgi:hypothetical protein